MGLRDVESKASVTPDTLFEIGSTSKAFSALNVAQQVDKGLMGWDDRVLKYYDADEFQLYDPAVTNTVTLRDLLLMRTGMPTQGGSAGFSLFNDTYPEILYKFRFLAHDAPFRSKWQYNNILYCLPSYSAARVRNTSWQNLIKTDLLKPLGMKTATTNYKDFLNNPNHATSYKIIFNGNLIPYHWAAIDSVGPSGSIGASIKDMTHWIKFQIAGTGIYNGKRLVSKANLDLSHTGQIDIPGRPAKFGLGWAIMKDLIMADGSTQSSQTKVGFIPSKKIGMVFLTNQGPYGADFNQAVYLKLIDMLEGKHNTDPWPDLKKKTDKTTLIKLPDHPLPSQPLNTYLGKYSNPYYGIIKISRNKNSLILFFGNSPKPHYLIHWDQNTFFDPCEGLYTFTDISQNKTKKLITPLPDNKDPHQPPKANATFNRSNG